MCWTTLLYATLCFQLRRWLIKKGKSFKRNSVNIVKKKVLSATGSWHGSLYTLDLIASLPGLQKAVLIANDDIWLARMEHTHHNAIFRMAEKNIVNEFTLSKTLCTIQCEPCTYGKLPRSPILSNAKKRECVILERVHSEVHGPVEFTSKSGAQYFVTFIYEASRRAQVYPISVKSKVFECFQKFQCHVKQKIGKRWRHFKQMAGKNTSVKLFQHFSARKTYPVNVLVLTLHNRMA